MDELDAKILGLLRKNARKKFLAISKEIDVSESTIRKRVQLMEQNGVISGYETSVNPRKLGFDAVAWIGINVDSLKFLKVVEALSKIEDIEYLATCAGEHMIMIQVWKKSQEELSRFVSDKIAVIDGVQKISPTIVLEVLKKKR